MTQKPDAATLREKAEAYFTLCDATRERVTLKNGEIAYYQVPYTLAGLCASLGVGRDALEKARREGPREGDGAQESAVLAWAAARVEQHLVERALLGELNSGVALMLLREWGYGGEPEKPGQNESAGAVTVVLEDPEELGR